MAVIDIVAKFSLTESSSKFKALFDLVITFVSLADNSTTSTLSVAEFILILGVPVKVTSLL